MIKNYQNQGLRAFKSQGREEREISIGPKKVQPFVNDSGLNHDQNHGIKKNSSIAVSKVGRYESFTQISLNQDYTL